MSRNERRTKLWRAKYTQLGRPIEYGFSSGARPSEGLGPAIAQLAEATKLNSNESVSFFDFSRFLSAGFDQHVVSGPFKRDPREAG